MHLRPAGIRVWLLALTFLAICLALQRHANARVARASAGLECLVTCSRYLPAFTFLFLSLLALVSVSHMLLLSQQRLTRGAAFHSLLSRLRPLRR